MQQFDAIIIGTGQAGPALAARLSQAGMKIAVIERKSFGGTCVNTGCDEVVHTVLDLMYAGAPYTVLQRAMHIHPTVSELLPTMMGELKPLALAAAA